MDFVTGLPRSLYKFDSIWVIVDKMTKSTHFLPVRTNYSVKDYAKIFIEEIVKLHGALGPLYLIKVLNSHLTFGVSFREF